MNNDKEFSLMEGLVITEANILMGLEVKSYQEVILCVGERLFKEGYVKDSFVQAVLDREKEFPTGLQVTGGGVALPHTDAEHVITSTLGIATLTEPVDFRAMAEPDKIIPVSIVIMLAVADPTNVVPVLRKVISILQNASAIKALNAASSKQKVKQIIIDHIKSQN